MKIIIVIIAMFFSLYIGWKCGVDYTVDQIKMLIDSRRKYQAPNDIITAIIFKLNELKRKGE